MSNIEIRLFQSFVTLCEERNFARAADRLGIASPTLSHQIQSLERKLGVRLLIRKTKMEVRITDAGQRFLESARNVLQLASEAELTARQAARGEIGRVDIGYMVSTSYSGVVQRCVGHFREKYPAVDIGLRQTSTVKLIDGLMSNELDAGFARLPKQFPLGLSGFPIYRHPVVVALPANHRLAQSRAPIPPFALADETFVSTSVAFDMAFTRLVESIAAIGGFKPKVWKRAEDLTTVLTYVSAGYGIAAVSEEMSNCHVPNVTYRKINSQAMPDVVIAFIHRTDERAPACKAFIETMRSYAAEHGPRTEIHEMQVGRRTN